MWFLIKSIIKYNSHDQCLVYIFHLNTIQYNWYFRKQSTIAACILVFINIQTLWKFWLTEHTGETPVALANIMLWSICSGIAYLWQSEYSYKFFFFLYFFWPCLGLDNVIKGLNLYTDVNFYTYQYSIKNDIESQIMWTLGQNKLHILLIKYVVDLLSNAMHEFYKHSTIFMIFLNHWPSNIVLFTIKTYLFWLLAYAFKISVIWCKCAEVLFKVTWFVS